MFLILSFNLSSVQTAPMVTLEIHLWPKAFHPNTDPVIHPTGLFAQIRSRLFYFSKLHPKQPEKLADFIV